MAPRGWRVAAGERRVGAAAVAAAPRFAHRHGGVLRQAQSGTDRVPAFARRRGWGGWSRAVACAAATHWHQCAVPLVVTPAKAGIHWLGRDEVGPGLRRGDGMGAARRLVARRCTAGERAREIPLPLIAAKAGIHLAALQTRWARLVHPELIEERRAAGLWHDTARPPIRGGLGGLLRGELAQHVMQDAAVAGEEGPLARHCRAALPNARAAGAGGASARSAAAYAAFFAASWRST
jgi:hypothetical protein